MKIVTLLPQTFTELEAHSTQTNDYLDSSSAAAQVRRKSFFHVDRLHDKSANTQGSDLSQLHSSPFVPFTSCCLLWHALHIVSPDISLPAVMLPVSRTLQIAVGS